MKRAYLKGILIAAIMVMLSSTSYADDETQVPPGTVIGHVYATDIVTYLDGVPIPSVNIGGKMAVLLEDLVPYGFSLQWDPEVCAADLNTAERPDKLPDYTPVSSGTPGQVIGNVYATGIRVSVNHISIPAFNLGGKMAVCLRDLAAENKNNFWQGNPNRPIGYSNYGFRLEWDPDTMTSRLYSLHAGDQLEVDGTEYLVTGFLDYTFHDRFAYATIYKDGEEVKREEGGQTDAEFNGAYKSFCSVEFFALLLDDYSWSFENGKISFKLPNTVQDYFYTGQYDITEEQEAQYPNRRGISSGAYVSRSGVMVPVVSIPVCVEQNGVTTEYQVSACVSYGSFFLDLDFFQITGLPLIGDSI